MTTNRSQSLRLTTKTLTKSPSNSSSSYKSKDINNYVITFEGVWNNKELHELFYKFLKKELATETYDFIKDVEKLANIKDEEVLVLASKNIIDIYLKENAKREVNIAAPVKKKVLEQFNTLQSGQNHIWKLKVKPEEFFGECKKALLSTLKHDSFKRFIRTKEFTVVIDKYVGNQDIMIPRISFKYNYEDKDFHKPQVTDKDFEFVQMLLVDGFNWELIGAKFEHGNYLNTYWSTTSYLPILTFSKNHKLHTLKYECVLNCRFNQAVSLFPNGALYEIDPNTAYIDTLQYWKKDGKDMKRDHYVSKSSIIFPFPLHQRVFYACVCTDYDPKKKRLIEILKPAADISKGGYCEMRKETLIPKRGSSKYVEKDCYLMFDLMAVVIEKIDDYRVSYAQTHIIGIGGWSDLDFMSKQLTHDRGIKLRNALVKKLKSIPEDITFEELKETYKDDSMLAELESCEGLMDEFPKKKDGKIIQPRSFEENVQEKKEEIKEEVKEKVEIKEEVKVEIKEEVKEETKEQMKEEVKVKVNEEIKEQMKEEVKEKLELKEEAKDEVKEELKEEIKEELKEEIKEEEKEEEKELSTQENNLEQIEKKSE